MLNVITLSVSKLNAVILSVSMLNAIMLSVNKLNDVMLSVSILNVIILNINMQNVIMLGAVTLIVVAPIKKHKYDFQNCDQIFLKCKQNDSRATGEFSFFSS
jgi:hypothetical protein